VKRQELEDGGWKMQVGRRRKVRRGVGVGESQAMVALYLPEVNIFYE
jgi:hypothetical protein